MRRAIAAAALILAASAALAGERGRVDDAWAIPAPPAGSPLEAATSLVERRAASLRERTALLLDTTVERASITGTHFFFRQTIDGIPVVNGGIAVSIHADGSASVLDRTGRAGFDRVVVDGSAAIAAAADAAARLAARELECVELVGWIGDDGLARPYQRVVVRDGLRRHAIFVDATTGAVAWDEPLYFTARARVFDANPVTTLNDPALLDGDDAAAAVPSTAYADVELQGLDGSGPLAGPYASIVDVEIPATTRADQSASLELTRDRDEFEEVNAYFQIDRAQRYLRELGFTGAREVVPYPLEVDAHAAGGVDESSYRYGATPGRGRLFLGDGGVDDAEDADIVVHEFGHAIQDSIVPGGFSGPSASEARALGEGFCDYWAFSSGWSVSRASGRDPFCIGDWDVRCAPGASTQCGYAPGTDCLRRVDGTKTMADYRRAGSSGTEHRNGEIWSSALREIFVKSVALRGEAEGRRIVDRTLVESHFGLPPNPTFRTAALRLVDADRRLNDGALTPSICAAMTARGIVESSECDLGLRGDLTLVQSPARGTTIPDFDPAGISATLHVSDSRVAEAVYVRVEIEHPHRGDLRLTLVAPDGASAVLQVETGDPGEGIRAVYGIDAEPAQPLSTLAGRPAAGTWTLRVVDTVGADVGRLVSWGMMFRFAGDEPIVARGASGSDSRFIPVSGSVHGAFGTRYVSDVRLANTGTTAARLTLFYTPSGTDGLASFSATKLEIPPAETVALDDIGTSLFRESGIGAIEIRGDTAKIVVTSRIYNDTGAGTYGQFVRPASGSIGVDSLGPLDVLHLSNGEGFRSNLGVAEIGGNAGKVEVRLFAANGSPLATQSFDIAPFGHVQIPLLGGQGGTAAEVFRAEVRVVSGKARVFAYGSVVDNASGDAIFVPGSLESASPFPMPEEPYVVPAVIRADGANGTRWRSDLRILNRETPDDVVIRFLPADGSAPQSRTTRLGAGEVVPFDDVLLSLFGLVEGRGTLSVERAGGTTRRNLVVTSRTWTPGANGTYGQFIPGVPMGGTPGRENGASHLVHVDSDARFRCNAGITEVAGQAVTVRVSLFDAAGEQRFSTSVPVPARGNVLFNLSAAGAPPISNGRLTFDVIEGDGEILPYASIVDNATGDPIFVSW